jgi:hypothetical protein
MIAMDGPNRPDDMPDDWWWLTITTPHGVHLYELGYPREVDVLDGSGRPTGTTARTALPDARHDEILAEIGATWEDFSDPFGPWRQEMAPGRPNRHLEPKQHAEDGTLSPIRPKPGVTLHLLDA